MTVVPQDPAPTGLATAVHRDIVAALDALPEDYFARKRSPYWPGDPLGHAAGHRTRHLERMR